MYKNTEHTVRITDFGTDGEGICKIDGYTVFVPSAVKGDLCRILVVKENKSYGYGKLLEVIEPSRLRTVPLCPVFGKCGGCSMQSVSYENQLEYKRNKVTEALRRIGGFTDIEVSSVTGSGKQYRYRNKAQYPVALTPDGMKAGFYAPHSHRVVPSEDCPLQDSRNNAVIAAVVSWANEEDICAYDENSGRGILRRICIRSGKDRAVLVLVAAKKLKSTAALVEKITSGFPFVSGIVINYNKARTNVIYGEYDDVIFGVPYIYDSIGEIHYKVHYRSFYQVNPHTTELLYKKALELADCNNTQTVFDLYCGTGTISLFLAKKAKKIIGIEIVEDAVINARENAELNGIRNAEFYCGEAEVIAPALISGGNSADVVVLDPPRKGCDGKLVDSIGEMHPERIVYVSCDCATMARDAKKFAQYGYKLKEVHVFDQFPQTSHVECCVLLCRT